MGLEGKSQRGVVVQRSHPELVGLQIEGVLTGKLLWNCKPPPPVSKQTSFKWGNKTHVTITDSVQMLVF